jgi:glycerol-3-phosphate acyltransferase PlsX
VVCDGFTGNVVLKVGEGLAEMFERVVRRDLAANGSADGGPAEEALRHFKRLVDAEARGAAPLLGVNGLVLVAHGRSSPQAIRNAIEMAATLARAGFVNQIASALGG